MSTLSSPGLTIAELAFGFVLLVVSIIHLALLSALRLRSCFSKRGSSLFSTRPLAPWPFSLYVVVVSCCYIIMDMFLVLEWRSGKSQPEVFKTLGFVVVAFDLLLLYPMLFLGSVLLILQIIQTVLFKNMLESSKLNFVERMRRRLSIVSKSPGSPSSTTSPLSVTDTTAFSPHESNATSSLATRIKVLRVISSTPFIVIVAGTVFLVYFAACVAVLIIGPIDVNTRQLSLASSIISIIANVLIVLMAIVIGIVLFGGAVLHFVRFCISRRHEATKTSAKELLLMALNYIVDRPSYLRLELCFIFLEIPWVLAYVALYAVATTGSFTPIWPLWVCQILALIFPGGGFIYIASFVQHVHMRILARQKNQKKESHQDTLTRIHADFETYVRQIFESRHPICIKLKEFCGKEFSVENYCCVEAVLRLQAKAQEISGDADSYEDQVSQIREEWYRIIENYVRANAPLEVNLSSPSRKSVLDRGAVAAVSLADMQTASQELLRATLLNLNDTFHRFVLDSRVLEIIQQKV